MTKTEALNKAAQEAGYEDFDDLNAFENGYVPTSIIHRAMDIFAGEQYNQAIRDAAESAELRIKIRLECTNEELERGFANGLHAIIVNKESILNLIK